VETTASPQIHVPSPRPARVHECAERIVDQSDVFLGCSFDVCSGMFPPYSSENGTCFARVMRVPSRLKFVHLQRACFTLASLSGL